MISSKQEFLRSFLPSAVQDISYAQVDLDITDLSISDILRNVNKAYPIGSRSRNAIVSGQLVVGILCKTETIDPLKGIFLLIGSDALDFELVSQNYVIICVSETKIQSDASILEIIDLVTSYLSSSFKESLSNMGEFYRRFVYDPSEMEEDE